MSRKIIWTVNGDGSNAGKQVKAVLLDSDKLHERLHIAARSAMIQVMVHRQTTPLTDLLQGLSGKSVHVVGLKQWAEKHANVTIALDKNKQIKVKLPDQETISLEKALSWAMGVDPFWKENPPPNPFKGFDYDEELAKLKARAAAMAEAKKNGTLKRGKEIIELTPDQIASINLGSYR